MAFDLPNYGSPMTGTSGLMGPNQAWLNPNWSLGAPLGPSPTLPGGATPDLTRFGQINQQMAPNPVMPWLNAGIQGIGTLGNLFFGLQGMQQAREAFDWQKGMVDNNYWNTVKTYNTAMEDRVRGRYSPTVAARNQDTINAEIDKRKLGG